MIHKIGIPNPPMNYKLSTINKYKKGSVHKSSETSTVSEESSDEITKQGINKI